MEHLVSPNVLRHKELIRSEFLGAKPFKHVCIEEFFPRAYAEALLKEFPPFDAKAAIDEFGEIGGKAVKTDLPNIGPAYDRLYTYLGSSLFLDAISEMLGIPGLLFDPEMYGGGTHETLPGRELDPHVDFNYNRERSAHRRVNLLVYLNPEWDEAWGGAIELHSNPRDWEHNEIKAFNCIFNRCVIFETNEYSWHGFKRIKPSEDRRGLSRKCVSIYLYTKDRPKEEVAPSHGTFYVHRPLPESIVEGYTLSAQDVKELQHLLRKRDKAIRFYQDQELKFNRENSMATDYIGELLGTVRLPFTGYLLQKKGSVKGAYADGWVSQHLEVAAVPSKMIKGLRIKGWIPEICALGMRLCATVAGKPAGQIEIKPGCEFDWKLEVPLLTGEFSITVDAANRAQIDGGDSRDLAFVLNEIQAEH